MGRRFDSFAARVEWGERDPKMSRFKSESTLNSSHWFVYLFPAGIIAIAVTYTVMTGSPLWLLPLIMVPVACYANWRLRTIVNAWQQFGWSLLLIIAVIGGVLLFLIPDSVAPLR